jgi:hypothetical protein
VAHAACGNADTDLAPAGLWHRDIAQREATLLRFPGFFQNHRSQSEGKFIRV